ncbi:hypothetical protein COLO4_09613 [Corchorus olitorius]|uniref:F-box domain-containing protein n=1 Tax=Corchorus olitorius TaxID=93759 RepID=A0A1R3KBS5_9ROSI|nr:hypothetical protein COLO4_09613 [Corchorus olitorius]
MDSSKSKIQADDFGGRDRISGLPDEILLHILSYLFTKDIIVTSSLSSRWKSLWKLLSISNFDFDLRQADTLSLGSVQRERFELYDCVVPSLAEAHIRIGGVTYDYSQTLLQKLARNTLELLDRICNVKSLQLTANTLEAISHAEKLNVDRHQAFNNLTHLTVSYGLTYYSFDVVAFMHILHKSPNLQSLNFPTGLNLDGHILQEVAHVPLCLKRSLKKFSISQLKGKEEDHRRFLKLILTNANVLDYFSVHCSTKYPEKKMLDEYLSGFVRSNCVYRFV